MSNYNYFSMPVAAAISTPTSATGLSGAATVSGSGAYKANSSVAATDNRERVTRILVVGETRVGKTLLIRRLCDHIFGDTNIETSTMDYSPFNSNGAAVPTAAADSAADEDDLGPEWGPTVGLAIDALKRTTTVLSATPCCNELSMPSLYPPTQSTNGVLSPAIAHVSPLEGNTNLNGGYGGGGGYSSLYGSGLQYRGAATGVNNSNFNSSTSNAQLSQPFHAAPVQRRCSVTQTVEFHELGGTHGYRDVARLPLHNIQYDGVIFVYHRRNLTSTVYLTEWYRWVRNVLSTSASVSGSGSAHKGSNRFNTMPRFMLVGTQLDGDELTAAAAGVRKEVDNTLHIGTIAVSDEALLDGNFELKVRVLESPQTPTRRSWVKRACRSIGQNLVWPYHVLWCLWHPFFFLSEQYQEERGPRNKLTMLCVRVVERFVWLLYKLEQTLLYVMAVVLFGPYQKAVVLGHARSKQTLDELRKDEQCVAQAHVCRLDSDIALQSSLDEIVAFFDILLRED